jgi:hypothetical protein
MNFENKTAKKFARSVDDVQRAACIASQRDAIYCATSWYLPSQPRVQQLF